MVYIVCFRLEYEARNRKKEAKELGIVHTEGDGNR